MLRVISSFVVVASLLLWSFAEPAMAEDLTTSSYQRSYDFEAARNYRGAVRAIDGVPVAQRDYTFYLRKGWLLYLQQSHVAAIASYRKAVSLAPRATEPLLGLSLPQLALRRWTSVESTTRTILARDAKSYLGRSRLAWALYNRGRYLMAQKLYESVLVDYPANVDMRSGIGWCQLERGLRSQAASTFRALLRITPKHVLANRGLKAALLRR